MATWNTNHMQYIRVYNKKQETFILSFSKLFIWMLNLQKIFILPGESVFFTVSVVCVWGSSFKIRKTIINVIVVKYATM